MGTIVAEKHIRDFNADVIGAIQYIDKNQKSLLSSRWEKTRNEYLEYNEDYEDELSEMIPRRLPARVTFDKETEELKDKYDLSSVRLFIIKMCLDIRTNKELEDTITLGDVNDFLVAAGLPTLYPRTIEDIIYTYLIESAKPLSEFSKYYEYVRTLYDTYRDEVLRPMEERDFLELIEKNKSVLVAHKTKDYSGLKEVWLSKYRELNYDNEKMLDYLKESSDYSSIPNLVLIYLTVNNKLNYLTDHNFRKFDELVDNAFAKCRAIKSATSFADGWLAAASSDEKFKKALEKISVVMLKSQQEKMIQMIKEVCGEYSEKSLIDENVCFEGKKENKTAAKRLYGKYSDYYRKTLSRENIIEVCTLGLNFDFYTINEVLESGGFSPLDIKLSPSEAFFYYLLKSYIPHFSRKYDSYADIIHHMMTEISKDEKVLNTFNSFFDKKTAELFSFYI